MIIFKTTCLINGKIFVGQSAVDNPNFYGSGKFILSDIRKYGIQNFQREILEDCTTPERANNRELHWIKKLKADDDRIGYNTTHNDKADNDKLEKKVQVLLTSVEYDELYDVIIQRAVNNKHKPKTVSSYIRDVIKSHINQSK